MSKKINMTLTAIFILLSAIVYGADASIFTLQKNPETYTLKTWGNYQAFQEKKVSFTWNQLEPGKDIFLGGGFGYLIDEDDFGAIKIDTSENYLKSGKPETDHIVYDFNIPYSSNYSFGLIRNPEKASAVLYLESKNGYHWTDIKEYLKNNNYPNVLFRAVLAGEDFNGKYIVNGYDQKITKEQTFEKPFATNYSTSIVNGMILQDTKLFETSAQAKAKIKNLNDSQSFIVYETTNYIKDIPLKTSFSSLKPFLNNLKRTDLGYNTELSNAWKMYKGLIFIYQLDKIE